MAKRCDPNKLRKEKYYIYPAYSNRCQDCEHFHRQRYSSGRSRLTCNKDNTVVRATGGCVYFVRKEKA